MISREESISAKPFVKWVGGKTQLLNEIKNTLPNHFGQKQITYIEPFVGGGAVLFWILQQYPNIERAVINDINQELICTYNEIKNNVESLIAELFKIQSAYLGLTEESRKDFYLSKRSLFNSKHISPIETAALFIFLNKTCFNGLYRVNSKGEFNVPHGKYKNPRICDEDNLIAVSRILQRVDIICGDFAKTKCFAGPYSLYYIDPPYKPLTATSSFTSYAKGGFDDNEQIRLRDFCNDISKKGALFIASNSDPKNIDPKETFFDTIYNKFMIKRVSASRMINSDASGRGSISELMISNVISI